MTKDGDKPPDEDDDTEEVSVVDVAIDETAAWVKRMFSIFRKEVAHPARRAVEHGAQRIDTLLGGIAGDDDDEKPRRKSRKK